MSSLTEQERMGLEDVFLSISSSQNLLQKWKNWQQNVSTAIERIKGNHTAMHPLQTKNWMKNTLNNHKITKLFIKLQKRRKI